jgi:DNA-binding NarL/FixJ family response regulator
MTPEIYREPLSKREKRVASLVTAGLSPKQIARHLGISVKRAKKHVTNVFTKLLAAQHLLEAIENAVRSAWDAGWGKDDIDRAVRRGRAGKS